MPQRQLSDVERQRIEDAVVDVAPKGMSDDEFDRWYAPRVAEAIGRAESLPAEVTGGAVGRLLGGLWKNINPIPLAQTALSLTPENTLQVLGDVAGGIVGASVDQGKKALASAKEGNYLEALGHAGGAIPLIGPGAAAAGERIASGDIAGGIGEGIGMVLPIGAAMGAAKRQIPVRVPGLRNPNPVKAAEVAWGRQQGLDIDMATATGRPFIRATQRIADESLAGSTDLVQAQAEQLGTKGRELAQRVAPSAETPESVGLKFQDVVNRMEKAAKRQADEGYGEFRRIEALPESQGNVRRSGADREAIEAARNRKMRETLGEIPNAAELSEMRQVLAEMREFRYQSGKLVDGPKAGLDYGEHYYTPRVAGAPVYNDILAESPSLNEVTRGEVEGAITKAIETGSFTNPAVGALKVARARLAGKFGRQDPETGSVQAAGRVSRPALPPEARDAAELLKLDDAFETMALPVNIRGAKATLRPAYERLKSTMALTQQQHSPAFRALEEIVTGPDHMPAGVLDSNLSALKRAARGGKEVASDAPRSAAMGLAAHQIAPLEAALAETLQTAPGAAEALEKGRVARTRQAQVAAVRKKLPEEPVKLFERLTARDDTAVKYLEKLEGIGVKGRATRHVGRAVLDEMLNEATAGGGFDKARTLKSKWDKLGPRTKEKLFGPQHTADLDKFFSLADTITHNVNPSGTAGQVGKGAQLMSFWYDPYTALFATGAGGALSRIMHSPKLVKAMVEGTTVPARSAAAQTAWITNFSRLVREAEEQEAGGADAEALVGAAEGRAR